MLKGYDNALEKMPCMFKACYMQFDSNFRCQKFACYMHFPCMLTCDSMHACCMHVTWMLHEHACVLPGFGTFFRQVSCMNMHNSCYVHVTCMVACYMNMHSMCMLHACYMPVACTVLCMLHSCTLPGLTCMYQTVVRTNGSKYNNNAWRTQSVNVHSVYFASWVQWSACDTCVWWK